jgi:2-polyprenyl-3-methyl-5-hydroxy-6-metoxy-1,4-benzoquinol methylase
LRASDLQPAQTDSTAIEPIPTRNLKQIYDSRFNNAEAARKDAIWREVTRHLQRYVPRGGVVLDVACDRGDFIRNIVAGEKWATDLRDVSHHLGSGIRFVQADGLDLARRLPRSYFDVVFMSNYLEHLRSADAVIRQLEVAHELLRTEGKVIVLQPNIRLVGGRYWDFIDHCVALTEHSLAEAAELAGLRTIHVVARFLPFTTKSRLPQHPLLVRAYLAFPIVWLLMGKQTLYVGERSGAKSAT